MSNGLADASFFPTAKELSTGLRWFKDHPVLAAAAATAVSVITYLNATDALAPTNEGDDDGDDGDGSDGYDGGSYSVGDEEEVYYRNSSGSSSRRRRDADDDGGDGKLSVAVSWCDEHGGSLTQVFEHSDESDEEPARPPHYSASNPSSAERRAAGARMDGAVARSGARICDTSDDDGDAAAARPIGAIRKNSTQRSIASAIGSPDVVVSGAPHRLQALRGDESPGGGGGGEGDLQTESPQWGWYVAITPPQDHVHASLPRVALLPPRTQPSYSSGIARPPYVSVAPAPTLRRSVSGRIP